jgi:hypothetical protein
MGFNDNIQTAAAAESWKVLEALLAEQRETNRLLRKLAGEAQPEFEASDQSRVARWSRKAEARKERQ